MSRSRTGLGRRHYRLLAGALHTVYLRGQVEAVDTVMDELIYVLGQDHPGFDAARFRVWVRNGDDGRARRRPLTAP